MVEIIQRIAPSFTENETEIPFRELGIDSIDLVAIRVEIEKHIGYEIPESQWYKFKNFQDVITHIGSQKEIPIQAPEAVNRTVQRNFVVGMPQMANGALSENWLFKEIGDIHWELLCKGLYTESGSITDESGNRLYATFTRIQIQSFPLSAFKENHPLSLSGTINRFGTLTYISDIQGKSDQHTIAATLMTSFSQRGGADNLELIKSQPHVPKNTIGELHDTPPFFNDYRLMRKGLLETHSIDQVEFRLTNHLTDFDIDKFSIDSWGFLYDKATNVNRVDAMIYNVNPFYEINGVGLVYFASYPVIADYCQSLLLNALEGSSVSHRYEEQYTTIERDVFYYANCNANDRIIFVDNGGGVLTTDLTTTWCSLYRESDMIKMADIFTVKKKIR